MDQRELYAKHALASNVAPANVSSRTRDLVGLIAQECDRLSKDEIAALELGIGDGELTFELTARLPKIRVMGVDVVQERVEACQARAANEARCDRASFRVMDVERELTELPSESVDVVVAIDVMEHLFDVFGFVDQLARVIVPGGALILRVPNAAYIKRRIELLSGRLPVTASWFGAPGDIEPWRTTWGWDGGHLHFFTLSTLRALLGGSGFTVRTCTDPGARLYRLRTALPGLLCGNLCVVAGRTGD
jgi:2-polyprenyl-3-methyl-5-hydroxy-6-metoxy-1,4-benzoquinol methylase